MKKNNSFILAIALIGGSILFFLVSLYIFAPSYRFETPSPFSGKYIYNPYQKASGYDWRYVDFRNDSISGLDIPVYEYGHSVSSSRYLCIDYQSKRKLDYPLFQNINLKQHNINCLNKKTSSVALTNLNKGFKSRELRHLDHYRLMEVMSGYGCFFNHWDIALSSGHRVNILASSDISNEDGFEYKTVISEKYTETDDIIKSLNDCDFYAISYRRENHDLPKVCNVTSTNDTVHISTDKMIKELRFIGQNGKVRETLFNVNQGLYIFKEDDSYIRIEMDFNDETTIYLNPIVGHQFQYFFDPSLSETMTERTWMMRIIYICVIIFFVKHLLSNKKVKANEDKGK